MEIQLNPPRCFTRGDTVQFRIDNDDYQPPTWSGTFALVSSSNSITFAASDNGDGSHLVELTAAQTANLAASFYRYQFSVTDGTERYTISQGALEVLENLEQISGGKDMRSNAAQIYDTLTDVMFNKAKHDQSSVSIGGRSLSRYSWAELAEMRGYYAHQMSDDERVARGFAPAGPRTVRFVR